MRKGLFIGLGGSGTETVALIKAKLLKHIGNSTDLMKDSSFLCFDTDKDTFQNINSTPGMRDILSPQEFKDLGDTNPYQVFKDVFSIPFEQDRNAFFDWAYKPENWPNNVLSEGAKAERQYGRSAIFKEYDPITTLLMEKIQGLNIMKNEDIRQLLDGKDNQSRQSEIETIAPMIWIFSSSCGGTGSSLLMDILYLIDRIYKYLFSALGEAYVQLFLYTSKPYIKKNLGNIRYSLNPIAIFNEINQVWSDYQEGINTFDSIKAKTINKNLNSSDKFRPFRYIIPIDSQMGVQEIPLDNLYEMTAQLCAYMHLGSGGGKALSHLDNDVQNCQNNPKYTRKDSKDTIWLPYLVASGFRTLLKPNQFLKDYIKARLSFEIVEYGLLGEPFDQIVPGPEQREVIKDFTTNSILKFLDANLQKSSTRNLEFEYKKSYYNGIGGFADDFSLIRTLEDKKHGDKESLNSDFSILTNDINNTIRSLEKEFEKSEYESILSKDQFLKVIELEIAKMAEEAILKHGLRYTEELIKRVDEAFCTPLLGDLTKYLNDSLSNSKLQEKIDFVQNIITKGSKKEWNNYQNACKEYADLIFEKFIVDCKIKLLNDLTTNKIGLLEKIRNLDNKEKGGIAGYTLAAIALSKKFKQAYTELSKTFKQTVQDLSTEYIPYLAGFTHSTRAWETDHEFSVIYEKAFLAKKTDGGITELGDPFPIRYTTSKTTKSLEDILRKLYSKTLKGDSLIHFCTPENLYGDADQKFIVQSFMDLISDSFLEELDKDLHLDKWLKRPLADYFGKELTVEIQAEYIRRMSDRNNILYNTKGSAPSFSQKIIYAGATENLAISFGHVKGSSNSEYVDANELSNTLYMIRLISGYTFEQYDQFENLLDIYNGEKAGGFIEYFPHLHKAFQYTLSLNEYARTKDLRKPETIFGLFYYEAILQTLFTKNKILYDKIVKATIEEVDELLNFGLTGTSGSPGSAATSIIALSIDKNNANVSIAGTVTLDKGFIQVAGHKSYNIPCKGAEELFTGFELIKDYEKRYLELIAAFNGLNEGNKKDLSAFISGSLTEITTSLGNSLMAVLNKNSFINDQQDQQFMRVLLSKVTTIRNEILESLTSV